MPKVTVAVAHQMDPEEVKQKATPVIEKTVKDFEGHDLQLAWTGRQAEYSFKSLAFTIKGAIRVEPDTVVVEVDLPFAAMMFKDKVHKAVTKNLTRAFGEGE
jgi:hypothetical protein